MGTVMEKLKKACVID